MLVFVACALSVLGLPLLLVTSSRLLVAGSAEFRARVLETLAAAVRRGLPVDPQLLWLVAHDSRGRRRRAVLRAAEALDHGAPLSEALHGALRLPPATTAAIAAAEGTPSLGDALREAANLDRADEDLRHGLLLRLAYPALVLAFLGGFLGVGIGPKFQAVCASMDVDATDFFRSLDVARWAGLALVAVTLLVALSWTPPVRAAIGPLAGATRVASPMRTVVWLRALAAAVRAGRPLHEALDRTADALQHPRHARCVREAARHLRRGEPLADVWPRLPVSRWLRARAALLAGPPEALASALVDLSRSLRLRTEAARERWLRILAPVLLTVAGIVFGLVLGTFFQMLEQLREVALW